MSDPTPNDQASPARDVYAELATLDAIVDLLDRLDDQARGRAMRWLADRYAADLGGSE